MLQDRGAMLTGMGIGMSLMYLLDPAGGRRRRALLRDRVAHAAHVVGDTAEATGRDVANRATGVAARVRGLRHDEPVDDRVLVERVRARLGRVVSHPRAIDVIASDGVVTLRGPILRAETSRLCRAVERISGVREVINELEEHDHPGNIPALQGGGESRRMWQGEWSPTTRVITALAATTGVGLLTRALKH